MTSDAGKEAYERSRKAVDAGRFEEAIASAGDAHRLDPEDGPIRELFVGLHLARGVKVSANARDLRRQAMVERDIPVGEEVQDSEPVKPAVQTALGAFAAAIAPDPANDESFVVSASTLHRY